MKPSFALDFRDGLVTLLHRTSRGWSQVGSTSVDAPDFAEALGYMRSTALGLSPRGITTKLIIPNEQVLYTVVHAPGPDAAKRKRQIKAGLEGRTPYPVEDLVYDWWGNGPDLNVAVIARETLAEAEGFATEHRFNPVSFVAVPDNGIFLGEPFFGPTSVAATLLTEGEKVERDSDPVTIIARDFHRSDPKAKPEAPVAEPAVEVAAAVPPVMPAEIAPEAPAKVAAEPATEAPVTELPPEPLAVAEAPVEAPSEAAAVAEVATPVPEPAAPAEIAAPAFEPAPPPVQRHSRYEQPKVEQPKSEPPQPAPEPEAPEAPMAMDVASDATAALDDDIPPAPAAEIVAAFASRRSAAIAAATAGSSKQAGAASKIPAVGPAPAQRPTVPRPNVARPAQVTPRETVAFPAKTNAAPAKAPPGKLAKTGGASVTAASILGARRERNVVPLPTAGTPESQAAAAAQRATAKTTTGLGSRTTPIKGKPRYLGLILTVVLLVLLVAVAAWSSFFMGATDTTGTGAGTPTTSSPAASLATPDATGDTAAAPQTTAAALPETVPAETVAADTVAAAPATTGAAAQASADASSTGAQTPVADPAVTAAAAPTPAATPDTSATAALPAAEPAPATEVSTVAAPVATPTASVQDKIVLATADTPPKPVGPLALPAVAAGADASPAAEPPPPPYGTVYKFDADGRIIPTPEGIITPEGVMLIAGKPKQIPPERPAELTTAAPAVSAAASTTAAPATGAVPLPGAGMADPTTGAAATTSAAPTIPAPSSATTATTATSPTTLVPQTETAPAPLPQDPTLVGKHPRTKPPGLAPAPDQQGAVATTPEDTRLAGLHPAARPKDLPSPIAADTGADAAVADASLASNGFALATSRKPQARPSGLDQAVDTAVEAALKEPAPDTQVVTPDTQVVTTAPEAQVEPDTEVAAPNLPTNASVAKQATTKRALNTNKLALLAVFGTPSTRFAMVRQGNGAVKKIKVGDTVDGGRVAAITANSVQYQKGGRIVTLSLPNG